jgi:hypothetical protein
MTSPSRCLFCLGSDGGFMKREHPIPESLGNHSVVIPAGVVCDRCNGGPLSVLDQTLVEFFPIKMRRTDLGIRSKSGRVPVTRLQENVRLEHHHGVGFVVGPEPKSWKEVSRSRVDPRIVYGDVELSGGRRMTPRYAEEVARAALKVGFECAWTEQGEALLEPAYDYVREIILGATWGGYLFFRGGPFDPRDREIDVWYSVAGDAEGNRYFVTRLKVYGLTIVTDSWRQEPPAGLTEDLGWKLTFPAAS